MATDSPQLPPADPIRLPTRPTAPDRAAFPLIACVAPLIAAGLIWWITGSALVLVFAVLSPVIAVAGLLDGRWSTARRRRRDAADYAAAMTEAADAVDRALERLRDAAWHQAPSVQTMLERPDEPGRWADPAEAPVVLGAGTVPSGLRLEGAGDAAEHRELRARAAGLAGAPIVVDPAGGIGLIGPGLLLRALARSLVVQLTGQLSPRSLGLRLPDGPDWAWAARLPHHRAESPAQWLTVLDADQTSPPPHRPGDGPWIALAGTGAGLPPGCATVVRVHGPVGAEIVRLAGRPAAVPVAPVLVAESQVAGLGEALGRAADAAGLGGPTGTLPDTVSFAALGAATGAGAASTRVAGPVTELSCAVGLGEHGPLVVDLVRDGPHALVGGTTGSGKSELLVTWVAALASRYDPGQVTFLLVDFKGGAAFDLLRALPHCVGLITDLDEREAHRALASLAAELRHRERVLRDAGARDITDLPSAALARLVIVVDEFATMVAAFPALHAVFVDIAARGRSLGVHLVLCTQRPAGVLRDALLANCSLRISLRVNNRADSQAVLGSDAAALIDAARPGRCALVRGSTPVETAQVAATGDADIRQIANDRPAGPNLPRRPWLDPLPHRVTRAQLAATGAAPPGLLLGLLDEPEHQRYRVAGYDPGVDGNLLVIGGARTGKSTLLAALAEQAPSRVRLVPADVEGTWDALVRAHAELDGLVHTDRATGAHRQEGARESRLLLIDDLDAVLARWGDEHRAAAVDLVTGLLRDGGPSGLRLVITVQRLTGALQMLPALCQSRVVLRLPGVHEHQAAGEPAASYDATLPTGGGRWRGGRIQLLQPEPVGGGSAQPVRRHVDVPSASDTAGPEGVRAVLLVVAGSVARSAAAFQVDGPAGSRRVVELAAGPVAGAGGRIEVSTVAAGTVLVGDADAWQGNWSLLAGLRRTAPLVFDGASLGDYRLLTRRRELPPPLAPGRSRGWLVEPDGTVRRVTLP
ncbi:ATP-binding protein [Cryobacterium arcticum]|uniref:Putative cell division-related protein n=1 Tax=Cryobacterium arcticum TaxID=670052 RepID=A0A1B1BGZ0_9MICO|nr:ATP-binding protein [Cryobacterium arcticum]ANP71818.1 Putative cell division-related protein [Cryobacterium arcticum]